MKNDPLNPGAVGPDVGRQMSDVGAEQADDNRPWYVRLFTSLRPSVSAGKDKRTGEKYEEFEIKGHIDF